MKWYTYLICFILIVVGTFCGIRLYKELTAESYINGSIDLTEKFNRESFYYGSTEVTFYHDLYDTSETYVFEKNLTKVEDFNGEEKSYKVVINDYVLTDVEFSAGAIVANTKINFYDINGEVICKPNLQIIINFYNNKTKLILKTSGSADANYLEEYFSNNGICLEVIEIL